MSFMVHASHAGAEFPDDIGKQVKYTHLDWINLEMVEAKRFKGVLPQLWGTIPRSPQVEEMLVAPSKRSQHELQLTCEPMPAQPRHDVTRSVSVVSPST